MRHGGLRRLREVAGVAAGNVVAIVGEDWQHERTGAKPLVLFLATSLMASHGYVLAARQCTHPLNQRNIAAHLPGFVRPGFMCSPIANIVQQRPLRRSPLPSSRSRQ